MSTGRFHFIDRKTNKIKQYDAITGEIQRDFFLKKISIDKKSPTEIAIYRTEMSRFYNMVIMIDVSAWVLILIPINEYRTMVEHHMRAITPELMAIFNHKSKKYPVDTIQHAIFSWSYQFIDFIDLDLYYETVKLPKIPNITNVIKPEIIHCPITTKINPFYTESEIKVLLKCLNGEDNVIQYIVHHNTIQNHANYIFSQNYVGFIKSYTMQTYKTINEYLRNSEKYTDLLINYYISKLLKLIHNAPNLLSNKQDNHKSKFIRVWRFIPENVMNQEYNDISIDQEFSTIGFISTTRDPLFYHESFGNSVIVIDIPIDQNGIALMIESYSKYIYEVEILLAHGTVFKMKKRGFEFDNNRLKTTKTIHLEVIRINKTTFNSTSIPNEFPLIPLINFEKTFRNATTVEEGKSNINLLYNKTDEYHRFRYRLGLYNHICYINLVGKDGKDGYEITFIDISSNNIIYRIFIQDTTMIVNENVVQYLNEIPIYDEYEILLLKTFVRKFGITKLNVFTYEKSCIDFLMYNPVSDYEYRVSTYCKDAVLYLEHNIKRFPDELLLNKSFYFDIQKVVNQDITKEEITGEILEFYMSKSDNPNWKEYLLFERKHLCSYKNLLKAFIPNEFIYEIDIEKL